MQHHATELLGSALACGDRFPLLIKILDAREKLSLQVHPPAERARELGGEPKTEMWYIADAAPGAELYVGLKRGVTRAIFEERLVAGTVEECFHRVPVKAGEAMFLPSGRVHAIGGGLVIFEIQQNSDTTFRVFDWNRRGLDGKPRALHLAESLASIDFTDFEPALIDTLYRTQDDLQRRQLVKDLLFSVEIVRALRQTAMRIGQGRATILGVLEGSVAVAGETPLQKGQFVLIAANLLADLSLGANSRFLLIQPGQ